MESTARSMIEAKGLSKFFGPFVAIEDISFSIPEGQIVAFLGPNGAGKSTTMKILTGFMAPSGGTASIAGLDIQTDRIEASKKLGYLPENGPLYLDMTPSELLRFFGQARDMGEAVLEDRIQWVTEQCALHEVFEISVAHPDRQQIAQVARAVLVDPHRVTVNNGLLDFEQLAGEVLHARLAGARFSNIQEGMREYGNTKGVLVSAVEPYSPAWQAGLREGDIIVSANQQPVPSLEAFRNAVNASRQLLINLQRGNSAMFVLIR